VKTVTNKRLLIYKSRGDSNQCTPYNGKPDQHTTRFPRSVCVCPSAICISRGRHIATFRKLINSIGRILLLLRKSAFDSTSQPSRVARGTCLNFSPNTTIEEVGLNQASIDGRLLGLMPEMININQSANSKP
jgi:hypothetical protein